MPSPPLILRISSDRDFHDRGSRSVIPAPNRSYCSAPDRKTTWRRMAEKLAASIGRSRKEQSNGSDLTEENLQEHNRRQAIDDSKDSKCSPYYRGLLALERYKLADAGLSSPGRDSHGMTVYTSSTSKSSFIVKMKDWSNFLGKTRKDPESLARSEEITTSTPNMDQRSVVKASQKKPLRERVSEEQEAKQQQQRPSNAVILGNLRKPSENDNTRAQSTQSSKKVSIRIDDGDSFDRSLTGTEFVWASKYRPKALKDFICNKEIAMSLQGQLKNGDCGHYIFQGQPGVGKRTMIWAMLREVFGPDKIQAREERKVFDLRGESRNNIEVVVRESTQHVEVCVSKLKGYEKHIIVELIKETHSKFSNHSTPQSPGNCRAMILYEADRLSTDALLYIRWLLEKYKNTKVFFCCADVSKLQPIRMLCSVLKLLPPSRDEIVQVLEFIAKQEGIHLPHRLAERIADSSKNNLRQAIRSFEASWMKSSRLTEDQAILTGWEDDIALIAKKITQEQSSKQLYRIRGKLQLLSEHGVSRDFIFEFLVQELNKHLDEELQHRVDSLYKEYTTESGELLECGKPLYFTRNPNNSDVDKRINDATLGNFQDFMRIEEFIARFMSIYKKSGGIQQAQKTSI